MLIITIMNALAFHSSVKPTDDDSGNDRLQ